VTLHSIDITGRFERPGADADRRLGSGLVTLDSALAKDIILARRPERDIARVVLLGSSTAEWKRRGARV
jgi:hypothetical protein